jgi:ATP-dependent 26S proteasome regulatory subunit
MTTNHLQDVDEAVYRPGRVDHKIEFTFADQYQIKNIFKIFYDIEISQNELDKMAQRQITTSYIINTAINPNLDDAQRAIDIILGNRAI